MSEEFLERKEKQKKYQNLIKLQFFILILSGLIAGPLSGILKGNSDHSIVLAGEWIYFLYEYVIRTFCTLFGFIFTAKYYNISKNNFGKWRKISFFSLSISAVISFLIIPLIFLSSETYYAFMPFPWQTVPFQAVVTGKIMNNPLTEGINPNPNGATLVLYLYLAYQIIAFTGAIFLGRRWQCSMLCGMAGGHAESSGEVLPLIPHNKKRKKSKQINPVILKILTVFRYLQFLLAITLSFMWIMYMIGVNLPITLESLVQIERINYLIFGLLFMTVGWTFVGSRTYCLYCPAGTMMGLCGKLVGQRIDTNLTNCTNCGNCNNACKMSIDIRSKAVRGDSVTDLNCVGCNACVDACPTYNLKYSTSFTRYLASRKSNIVKDTE